MENSAWFVWNKLYPSPLNWKGWLSFVVFLLIVVINAAIFKLFISNTIDEIEFLIGFIFVILIFVIFAKIKS